MKYVIEFEEGAETYQVTTPAGVVIVHLDEHLDDEVSGPLQAVLEPVREWLRFKEHEAANA